MSRLPRLVLPGHPYHVTQRGNRRLQTFFEDGDFALYRDLLAEAADKGGGRNLASRDYGDSRITVTVAIKHWRITGRITVTVAIKHWRITVTVC